MIASTFRRLVKSSHVLESGAFPSWGVRLCRLRNFTTAITDGSCQLEPQRDGDCRDEESNDKALPVSVVRFEQKEMQAIHRILEELPAYRCSIFTKEDLKGSIQPFETSHAVELIRRDWSLAKKEEVLDAFRIVTSYAAHEQLAISNDCFSPLCSALIRCLNNCTDDDLLEVGKLMTLWPPVESTYAKNYQHFFNHYDSILRDRYPRWHDKRDYVLKLYDVLFWLRRGRLHHFPRMTLNHMILRAKEPHHVVLLMFYLSLITSFPMTYKAYDMEEKLYKFKDSYSLEEVGCAIYGLFRSKSRLQYRPLILFLLKGLLTETSTVSPWVLCVVSKALTLSTGRDYQSALLALQRKLVPRVPDLPVPVSLSVLWWVAHKGCVNETFMHAISLQLEQRIPENKIRVKDLVKFLTVGCEYRPKGLDLKSLSEKVSTALQNQPDSKHLWQKDFLLGSVLHRLLLCGVFPRDLVDKYLSTRTSVQDSIPALAIDVHIDAFYTAYDGARLNPILREEVFKYRFTEKETENFVYPNGRVAKRDIFNKNSIRAVREVLLDNLGGKGDRFYETYIVPSNGFIDIIFYVDKEVNFHSVPDDLRHIPMWELKRIPQRHLGKGLYFIALTFFEKFDEKKITCLISEKKDIIQMLGYTLVEMDMAKWRRTTSTGQFSVLLEDIHSSLNKNSDN